MQADSEELATIYSGITLRVNAALEARPVWACRRGCDLCCRRLANPPEMTAAEWELLYTGFQHLPLSVQQEVAAKIEAFSEREGDGFVVCPFLDEAEGACRVYAHRPAACRMYGFYVRRDGNQWCDDVQALYEAGEMEGVILGNYTAVERELTRAFGKTKPLHIWFQEACKNPQHL